MSNNILRSEIWVDKILKNLKQIENKINDNDFKNIRALLARQYQLVKFLGKTLDGDAYFVGDNIFKTYL